MSERKKRLLRIDHNYKFLTIKEAEKEAEAICAKAKRISMKKKGACKLLIGISVNDIRDSMPVFVKNGGKGRPIKMFISKYQGETPVQKKPHLHIIAYSNPGLTIADEITKSINKRFRKKYQEFSKKPIATRWECNEKYIAYVMHQSINTRQVKYDPEELLNDIDFKRIYEKFKPQMY